MTKTYRKGAIGALLDEYERAINELKEVISVIPDDTLTVIIDRQTKDEHCMTVQRILSHVVHAGNGYATFIHNVKGQERIRPTLVYRTTVKEYIDDLTGMFSFTEEVFKKFTEDDVEPSPDMPLIHTKWGQQYDVEQMMEHAIVHVLRHRRQLERIIATVLHL
jgi:uncharacterized damage-inducible protein DinB